ncbi:DUF3325 family protein [Massilia sp. HP4]|uniref:DUF3325 family protein n=1 Tax=Massilia sp. HP4 TaxID=2562316 RepID=UPI0010BFE138|nr:DUF3325 family protein [Massilia sp. HP4]
MQLVVATLFGVAAFAAAVAGLLTLGLTMERHWQEACGALRRPRVRNTVQALGALALLVSLLCCVELRAQGRGFVLWIGCLTAAVWIAIGLLAYGTVAAARVVRVVGGLAAASCVTAMVLRFG